MTERAFDKIAAGLTEAIEAAGDAAAQRSAHVTRGGVEDKPTKVPTIREWKNAQGQTVGAAEGVVKLREELEAMRVRAEAAEQDCEAYCDEVKSFPGQLEAAHAERDAALARAEKAERDAEWARSMHAMADADLAQNGAATSEIEAELSTALARIRALEEGLGEIRAMPTHAEKNAGKWAVRGSDWDDGYDDALTQVHDSIDALLAPAPPETGKDATNAR